MSSFTKGIELGIRSYLNSRIQGKGQPIVVSSHADGVNLADTCRIVFLRQDRIGDLLVSTGIINAVRDAFPKATIDIVLGTNNVAVKHALDGVVDNVILYEKGIASALKLIRTIRSNRYDVIVDLTDNASTTSSFIVSRAGARYALGVDKVNRGAYTHVVPMADRSSVNIVDRIARLLWFFGIDDGMVDVHPVYKVSSASRQASMADLQLDPTVINLGLNISGSSESRMYNLHDWLSLAKEIVSIPGVQLYVMSNTQPEHQAQAAEIGRVPGVRVVPATVSFHHFATVVSTMDGIITPDTSIVHLCAAFHIPSVVLFLHDNPSLLPWYPYHTVCYPCISTSSSIKSIPYSTILQATHHLIDHLR